MTIFQLLKDKARTQAEVARWCGQSKAVVNHWFKVKRIPPEHWRPIVKRLDGVSIQDLYDEFYPEKAA